MFIWIGSQTNPALLENLFGVPTVDQVDPRLHMPPVLPNEPSKQLAVFIAQLRQIRHRFLQLTIVRQGLDQHHDARFSNLLIEDSNHDNMSYVDYLCTVHRNIQALVSGK